MLRRFLAAAAVVAAISTVGSPVAAQVRGVYPLGMSAVNSGVTAAPGFGYANLLLYYERDRQTGPDGQTIRTGQNSVWLDMNSVSWVSDPIAGLGNANYSFVATIPLARNSLTADEVGHISGATGLGDSYFVPAILGWQMQRAELRVMYGFLAPTGRFDAGANDNVGSGYWTHTLSSGQTIYLTRDRATVVSAFEMYEIHGTQEGTHTHPGDTLNLDYSVMRSIALQGGQALQVGLAGYEQWQTSARTGPQITAAQSDERYRVSALGVALNLSVPQQKLGFAFRAFKEFGSRSTFEGYSVQASVAVAL